jgi:hypothetical protein
MVVVNAKMASEGVAEPKVKSPRAKAAASTGNTNCLPSFDARQKIKLPNEPIPQFTSCPSNKCVRRFAGAFARKTNPNLLAETASPM